MSKKMLKPFKQFLHSKSVILVALSLALTVMSLTPADANSRIKDIAEFEGVRDNMLVGYGIVVGLNGTGDTLSSEIYTRQSLIGMLERLGVNVRDSASSLSSQNIAAVMVTASLPAFARQGARIDVTVSALGTASSLLGGTLLVTPLIGADGEVYAVSQGQVATGGFTAAGAAETITKGVPTSARIANGAIIEREIGFELESLQSVRISLRNPDFTTARRLSDAVNAYLGTAASRPTDPGTVFLSIPSNYENNVVGLLTDIEQLRVQPDQLARVIIDEQSGVIVMGENVRVSRVAIAQGNLTIRVTETPQVSQPEPFSATGTTQTVNRSAVEVDEGQDRKLTVVDPGVSLQDLVDGLNTLGVGPRDMITILQAIKAAGSLQAEIEVM